ncbi:MAG: oligosaccharide flippase family protein [Candidatus Eisenbacteria bacterium]
MPEPTPAAAPALSSPVREALKHLTGESLIYGLGQVSGRAVNLLLVPVLTRLLTPQAYGVSDLVLAYSQTALLVLVFGMDGALARLFYDQTDREARIRMVSSSLLFRLVTGTAVALTLALVVVPLGAPLLAGEAYRKYLTIGAVTLPFTLLTLFANDVLRVTFQPWKFITLNLAQTVTVGGLTLYLVLVRDLGVVGVLYGKLGGDALTAALGLVLCRHSIRPRFDRAALRRMLGYGLPLVPVAFAYGLITGVDRFFLQRTHALAEVGVYAVAMKFFALATMGVSAFQLAFGPFAFARARTPEAPRLYARVFSLYTAVASLGALLVAAFAPQIVRVLAPSDYAAAAGPALWLTFAAVAQGAYYVAALGIGLSLRTVLLGWTAGGAALVAVAANAVLTPTLGASGAAVATFMGYAASGVLAYAVSQRVHPLPYRGGRIVAMFTLAVALALAAQRLAPAGVPGVGVKLAAAAAYAVIVWRFELWRPARTDGAPAPGA